MRSFLIGLLLVVLYAIGFGAAYIGLPYIEDRSVVAPPSNTGTLKTMRSVKLYFPTSASMAETTDCVAYTSVTRLVVDDGEYMRFTIDALLRGPTEAEKKAGFQTSIPSATMLVGMDVRDGVARLQFTKALDEGVAGSCMVGMIRSQIEQTARQFSGVRDVVLSIDGRVDDVLQP